MNDTQRVGAPYDVPASLPRLSLSPSQAKVIRAKYQRDDPSPERWLWRVAANIALAEVFFGLPQERVAEALAGIPGVHFEIEPGDPPRRILRTQDRRSTAEERKRSFDGALGALARLVQADAEARALHGRWARAFYDLMAGFAFLPNSPTLMNAGRVLQQLSACYVLPVPDTMEGIMDSLKAQALIHKSGGGTGFSFGQLRPCGARVASTDGVASGPVSFMEVFDKLTDVVKQGGTRRGANMGILPYTHPDIRAFIGAKRASGLLENFNISVAVDEAFFAAAERGADVPLIAPGSGAAAGNEPAADLLDLAAACAWETGDPGLVFLDRVNASASNPVPALGRIEATNPCGEQPLLPYEPCNLGSLNLQEFACGPLGAAHLDRGRLGPAIDLAVRLLDDVIEVNRYPLPEIEERGRALRRIGLGVMGFAEYLVWRGIPYGTGAALEEAEEVMRFVNEHALEASCALARERGAFPAWQGSVYDPDSPVFRGRASKPRHAARTTIAPTGTIAIAAGLQGGGIEPFFGLAYTRHTAQALDALRRGDEPDPEDVYTEVNPLLRRIAADHDFFGLSEDDLVERLAGAARSLADIPEVPEAVRALFPTAHDIPVEHHVRMQAAFQRHTDNAVSKTVNLPHDAGVADVRRAFVLAWRHGLKGITVYRDGSKGHQVLSLPAARQGGEPPRPRPETCERCFGPNVRVEGRCITCRDCGYSYCE